MKLNLKDKLKAAGIHLIISCILALLSFIFIFCVLYPSPLAQATGVGTLFIIMLCVDGILGPMLTFIVYKRHKKTLKIDLLVIVLIQLGALSYGMYTIYQGRPIWIAYTADRFELVRVNDVIVNSSNYKIPYLFPEYIDVETKPKNVKEQLDMMLNEVQSNISPAQQSKYHRSFNFAKTKIARNAIDLTDLKSYNDSNKVENILKKYPQANAWLPLKANAVDMVVLINKEKAQVVKIVDLRPWH